MICGDSLVTEQDFNLPDDRSSVRHSNWLPLITLLLSVSALSVFWFSEQSLLNTQAKQYFALYSRELTERIRSRLDLYNLALLSGRAFITLQGTPSRASFHTFVTALNLNKTHLGLQGIGFSLMIPAARLASHTDDVRRQGFPQYHIHPVGPRPFYTSILYLEPFDWRNQRAFGYDMYTDPVRRQAMQQACDRNDFSLSGKVELVQETPQQAQTGFLIYLPVYQSGPIPATLAERRANLLGWIYAPYRAGDFLRSILDQSRESLTYAVYDGDSLTPDHLLQSDQQEGLPRGHYYQQIPFQINDHRWTIVTRSTPSFDQRALSERLNWIIAFGLLLSLSTTIIVFLIVQGRGRALRWAHQLNRKLIEREQQIQQDNIKLQANEDNLLALLNISPIAVRIAVDHGRRVVFHNTSYAHLINNTQAQGVDPELYYTDSEQYKSILHELDQGASVVNRHVSLRPHQHPEIWCLSSYTTMIYRGEQAILAWFYDITPLKTDLSHSVQREQDFRHLIDALPYGILIHQGGVIRYANQAASNIMRSDSPATLHGIPVLNFVHPDFRALVSNRMRHLHQTQENLPVLEETLLRWDGSSFTAEVSVVPIHQEEKLAALVVFQDISERKQAADKLRISATVFRTSLYGILITNRQNQIIEVNPAFTNITGFTPEETLGNTPALFRSGQHDTHFYEDLWRSLKEERYWRGEIWNRRKSGEIYPASLAISTIQDEQGGLLGYAGMFSDISDIKNHQSELERIAHFDPLTGLPNRALLKDRMTQAFALHTRNHSTLAICYLDLDGFKEINDQHGHEAGDRVLVEMAQRMSTSLREGDTVSRLGGDEFVLLLNGYQDINESLATLQRLLTKLCEPIQINKNIKVSLSASMGMSMFPSDDRDPEILLRQADQAMYSAKQGGKNQIRIYDPHMALQLQHQLAFKDTFQQALESGQLELFFQPVINLENSHPIRAEVLLRWRQTDQSLLLPDTFLPSIQGTPLDVRLGEWVIGETFRQLQQWHGNSLVPPLSVNLSAYHLQQGKLSTYLSTLLEQFPKVAPSQLRFEIPAIVLLEPMVEVDNTIRVCRTLGFTFSLDNFGMGYPSLSYLRKLSIDEIKIDRTFVASIAQGASDRAIIESALSLGRAFRCPVVAKGIETEKQYRLLRALGCHAGQGFLFSDALTAQALLPWCLSFTPTFTP